MLSTSVATLWRRATNLNSFTGQVSLTMATNVIVAGFGILTGILAARLLGPEGRGELAAIVLWGTQIATFAMLGIDVAIVFFVSRFPERLGSYLGSAQFLSLVSGAGFVILGWLAMPFLLASQNAQVIFAAQIFLPGMILAFALGGLPHQMLRAVGAWRAWNLVRLSLPLSWAVLLGVASVVSIWATSTKLMVLYLLTYVVMTAVSILATWGFLKRSRLKIERALFAPLLRYGLPCMLTVFPYTMNLRLDQLLMATLFPSRELGLYVVAVAWSGASVPVLNSVGPVLFPKLSALREDSHRKALVGRTLTLLGITNVILTLLTLLATPFVIPFLFGSDYAPAVLPAAILVLANMFNGMNLLLQDILRGLGSPRPVLVAETVGLIVTLVLLVILLPLYGMVGAAIASLGAYAAISIALFLPLRRGIFK